MTWFDDGGNTPPHEPHATGSRAANGYDGAHYRTETSYVCDCGFTTQRGEMNDRGGYPGSKVMVAHLIEAHGWERGKSNASYHGSWQPPPETGSVVDV